MLIRDELPDRQDVTTDRRTPVMFSAICLSLNNVVAFDWQTCTVHSVNE